MAKETTTRRAARERALGILYTVEVGRQEVEVALADLFAVTELDERTQEFVRTLVNGTLRNRRAIDVRLHPLTEDFPMDRQTAVDRNILRMAAAEMLFQVSDAPPAAVVNEAIELAKKYSTGESGRFVNGVLGALVRQLEEEPKSTPAAELETQTENENG